MTRTARRAERGSGTVLVATFVGLVVTAALALAVLGGLLVRQRELESAADLAALAGAAAAQQGQDGCARARLAARRNGVALVSCQAVAGTVEVTAGRAARLPFGETVSQVARARAGPSTWPSG